LAEEYALPTRKRRLCWLLHISFQPYARAAIFLPSFLLPMAIHFQLRSHNSRGNFDLIDAQEQSIGSLRYPKWYSTNAWLTLAGREFRLKKKSLWRNCAKLWEGDVQRGEVRFDWRGRVMLTLGQGDSAVSFLLRRRGFLKSYFELEDHRKQQVATITPHFRWRTFAYDAEVRWQSEQGNAFSRTLLLLLAGHAITVLRKQQSAAS